MMLDAQHLGRRHPDGQRWLLDDVSLSVDAHERVGVTGPSGSGKTLLLRTAALLDPIDRGQVLWRGTPVRHHRVPAFRAEVIYLHQRPALAADAVEAALRQPFQLTTHRHRAFDRSWAIDRLAELGREESFLQKLVRDLSGGEAQIVALLRAIQLNPAVLLLDEPTAAMDPAATLAVESLIDRWLSQPGTSRAIVWVSHDAEQTARMTQRVVRLADGRIAL
jgi:putative ABC transport system ATP-binding protein